VTVFDPATSPLALTPFALATQLLGVWQSWTAGRAAPMRAEVDPLTMPHLLANVILLDTCEDDFRFRLIGETVNARYGHGRKGRTLRELMTGPALEETLEEHRRCAEGLAGVFLRKDVADVDLDDQTRFARLLLPVDVIDGRARLILGIMEFSDDRALRKPAQPSSTNPSNPLALTSSQIRR